jgi:hypothetical protein
MSSLQYFKCITSCIHKYVLIMFFASLTACAGSSGNEDAAPVTTTTNRAPSANAGSDQTVEINTLVNLSSTTSQDPDGDSLTYTWSISSLPPGSSSELSNATSENASIIPDVVGNYDIQLIVNDGAENSEADIILVTAMSVANATPIANAGTDQNVPVNTNVSLSAVASQDPDGDNLTYSWRISSLPAGSSSTLSNATSENVSITPDLAGDYVIQLIVNDGVESSALDIITVIATSVANVAPSANAGADQNVLVNTNVSLSAVASQDTDGDSLTYSWSISSLPSGSSSTLTNPTGENAGITPDLAGDYIIQLIANDGTENSAVDMMTITASALVNLSPTANAGNDQTVSSSGDGKPKMGSNIDGISDWTSSHPFVDLIKYSRDWITACDVGVQADCTGGASWDSGEQALLDLDQDGWIRSLPDPADAPTYWFARIYWEINTNYVGGRHILTYDGEGSLNYFYGMNVISSAPGRVVLDIDPSVGGMMITLTATDPNGTGNYLRNIKIVREVHEAIDHVNNPFNPDFITSLSSFHLIRFMDWMSTNNSLQANWVDRAQTNDHTYSTAAGVPIEIQMKLASELSVSPWVNIPHRADDNYITQFATVALQELDSNLDIYVEYTNEGWNGIFQQLSYLTAQGRANWPGTTESDFTVAISWFGQRTANVCDIWKTVWADQSNRVHCVMGGFAANVWVTEQAMECPLSALAPCADHGIDSIAIAPYFGGELGWTDRETEVEAWDLTTLFSEINNVSIPQSLTWVDQHMALANRFNVELTAYEGGQHLVGVNAVVDNNTITNLFVSANRDPRMQQSYTTFLNGWKDRGAGVFANFSHVSRYSKWGSWGTLEYLSQPANGKMQALLNYIDANPVGVARVSLNGNGNDQDGSIASYLWEQTSGTSVTLINANTGQAYFDIPAITGTTELRFTLTATDNLGATATDEVVITVQ